MSALFPRQRRERGAELTVLSVDGKLLGDLGEVGPADEADHGLLANLLEEVEHLGRSSLRAGHRTASARTWRDRKETQHQLGLRLTRRAGVRVPSTSVCIDTTR